MATTKKSNPRIFVDADVLISGAVSPLEQSASQLVLRLAEITLIDAMISEQVLTEAERNLKTKFPKALPAFRHLVSRCLQVVPDPNTEDLCTFRGIADPKDLPILVACLQADCPWLVTFNLRHYQPGHLDVKVLRPGDFILHVRDLLSHL
jgi:predicted nucleic acid-binding protein